MKSPRKFLGLIPMETRRRRCVLVVGYYLAWVPVFAGCWFSFDNLFTRFLAFYFCLALLPFLLGGHVFSERSSAPVRPFPDILYRWQAWQRLRGYDRSPGSIILDEHDHAARDRAHYFAYTAIFWIVLLLAPEVVLKLSRLPLPQRPDAILLVAAPLLILFFSLPQTILLWTEPDLEPETSAATTAGFSRTGARP